MELAIVLSLAASACTATSSVCQRLGARHLERCGEMRGYLALRGGKARGLSSHISGGPAAIFTTWSAYVLMCVGTGTMLLTSHAMAAGPLAASQPGFTIGDPDTAIPLGVFADHSHDPAAEA
jgi:hypothetical protein